MDVMGKFNKLDKTFRVLVIALIVLMVLVPIGLIASGTAFGEWGPDELQQAVGYVTGRASADDRPLERPVRRL